MLKEQKNSKKQGDVGIGIAIGYFSSKGMTVAVPLTDSQDYDLIVEINSSLKKVQVKTTFSKNKIGNYRVELRTKTHSRGKFYSQKTIGKDIDFVFIVTEDGNKYLFPRKVIKQKTALTLSKKNVPFLL